MSDFSEIPNEKILLKGKHFFIIADSFPVSPGHLLIISNSSKRDYFELNKVEVEELNYMIHKCKKIIEEQYKPDGYNIGMNCGESAGQTVFQFHCHVIPRYLGDMNLWMIKSGWQRLNG
jgi:diadenosine tetraphosphate (Ap4A) HIT family hydrolase